MKVKMKFNILGYALLLCLVLVAGCSRERVGRLINPFADDGPVLGDATNQTIIEETNGGVQKVDDARRALKVMGEYQRAHDPKPANPVINPAVVRLMWIPDHVNSVGDLVPAHYYYLKIKPDNWNLKDAFDIFEQTEGNTASAGSATPWVYGQTGRRRGTPRRANRKNVAPAAVPQNGPSK